MSRAATNARARMLLAGAVVVVAACAGRAEPPAGTPGGAQPTAVPPSTAPATRAVASRPGALDWRRAASALAATLIEQDKLFPANGNGPKKQLTIGRIVNETGDVLDTDPLVEQVAVLINGSGKAEALTRIPSDPVERRRAVAGGATSRPANDYVLHGRMIEERSRASGVRSLTFYLQLTLADATGHDVWTKIVTVEH